MIHKPARTRAPIHPLLASRWSPRAFNSARPVSADAAFAIMEAARWAPSCFGAEPWRFVVCDKNADESAWQKALACLAPGNREWAAAAPLLIFACAEKQFAHNGKDNRHCLYDTGAAVMSMVVEAENQELRAHQMGGFDPQAAQKAFAIPDSFECIAAIAVGHQGDPRTLPDELAERETAERQRKPLGEVFFAGEWGRPVVGEDNENGGGESR